MSIVSNKMIITKEFTTSNLNTAKILWDMTGDPRRFGQFWMGEIGFSLPKDFRPGYNLWEEKDPSVAFGVIFDYIQSIQQL